MALDDQVDALAARVATEFNTARSEYVGKVVKAYANEAAFDAETESAIGTLTPTTNWGAYTGITSPLARDLTSYAGTALVQTVYSTRSAGVVKTQFILIADDQTADSIPTRRIMRRGNTSGWGTWRYDSLVPYPLVTGEAATKGYADSVGLTIINWADLDTLSSSNARVGLVFDSAFDLGAATGIAKYDGWLGGQMWYVSNALYAASETTAQVQQVWIPNGDGTLDEIRRSRSGGGSWGAWAIETPSGSGDPVGRYVGINAQTGTTYTPVITDEGKLVTLDNAGAITVTLPSMTNLAFPVGGTIDFLVLGAGMATFAAGAGATLPQPKVTTQEQYTAVTVIKISTDGWVAVGDLA